VEFCGFFFVLAVNSQLIDFSFRFTIIIEGSYNIPPSQPNHY
jgi:hypothetical protein